MMSLKYVMMVADGEVSYVFNSNLKHQLSNPWEGTQDGNNHKKICDYTGSNHGTMLHRTISYNIDYLENQPPKYSISSIAHELGGGVILPSTRQSTTRMDTSNMLQYRNYS